MPAAKAYSSCLLDRVGLERQADSRRAWVISKYKGCAAVEKLKPSFIAEWLKIHLFFFSLKMSVLE